MAQQSEQARLIASLQAKGYSVKQIASLTGRSERYVAYARDSVVTTNKRGKVASGRGQNLIPALQQLNERGKLSPSQIPERRKTKGGTTARVRQGTKTITTKKGVQHTITNVRRGPATLKKATAGAAKGNNRVRWDIKLKRVKTKSDKKGHQGWISGHLPAGWNAQTLEDRVNNPQEGDNWRAGDINGALIAIALEQNSSQVTAAEQPLEYNLFTAD